MARGATEDAEFPGGCDVSGGGNGGEPLAGTLVVGKVGKKGATNKGGKHNGKGGKGGTVDTGGKGGKGGTAACITNTKGCKGIKQQSKCGNVKHDKKLYGCSKCRGAPTGCGNCRNPGFKGKIFQRSDSK